MAAFSIKRKPGECYLNTHLTGIGLKNRVNFNKKPSLFSISIILFVLQKNHRNLVDNSFLDQSYKLIVVNYSIFIEVNLIIMFNSIETYGTRIKKIMASLLNPGSCCWINDGKIKVLQ